ncbi:MAG: hypothetical protein WBA22_04125 [Candidatus Methanofastidiosia archaeon]
MIVIRTTLIPISHSKFYARYCDLWRLLREIAMKVPSQSGSSPVSRGKQSHEPQNINHEQCPFCGGVVEHNMLLCPHYWQEIKLICENCKGFINVDWKKCVYCGADVKKKPKYEKGLTIERE